MHNSTVAFIKNQRCNFPFLITFYPLGEISEFENITLKLFDANAALRNERPNERLVRRLHHNSH